jgi:hypothetical protein
MAIVLLTGRSGLTGVTATRHVEPRQENAPIGKMGWSMWKGVLGHLKGSKIVQNCPNARIPQVRHLKKK